MSRSSVSIPASVPLPASVHERNMLIGQWLVTTLLPIIGIWFFDWDWRVIVVLYFGECWIVGLVAIVKTIIAKATPPVNSSMLFVRIMKFLSIVFFIHHFGFFSLAYMGLTAVVVGSTFLDGAVISTSTVLSYLTSICLAWLVMLIQYLAAAFREEARRRTAGVVPPGFNPLSLFAPYAKLLPLHVALFVGLSAVMSAKSADALVAIVLIAIHAGIDFLGLIVTKNILAPKSVIEERARQTRRTSAK